MATAKCPPFLSERAKGAAAAALRVRGTKSGRRALEGRATRTKKPVSETYRDLGHRNSLMACDSSLYEEFGLFSLHILRRINRANVWVE